MAKKQKKPAKPIQKPKANKGKAPRPGRFVSEAGDGGMIVRTPDGKEIPL